MGIFADDRISREYEDGLKFTFREPKFSHLLQVRDLIDSDSAAIQQTDEDEVNITIDEVNFDVVNPLIAELLVDWPADDEITEERIDDLKLEVYQWLMEQTLQIIMDRGSVSEDEEKN